MLVIVNNSNPISGSAHVAHAVVLEECLPNCYKLKNSYPDDPVLTIPKNRKTFYQNYIQANAGEFKLTSKDVIQKFEFHSGQKIEWDTTEWIFSDKGYSLKFQLKNIVGYKILQAECLYDFNNAGYGQEYLSINQGMVSTFC